MVEALVIVLTCIPILAGTLAGRRMGARRLLAIALPLLLGLALGIETARLALRAGWFEPFGLVTPVLLGIAVAIAGRWIAIRFLMTSTPGSLPGTARIDAARGTSGAILGSGLGVAAAASLWLAALLAEGALSSREIERSMEPGARKEESLLHALVRTANHGFVRHLPLLGGLGDEIEALSFIMGTPPEARAQLARELGWERLSDLSTFQTILEDPGTLEDLERAGDGDIASLYRLQKNPLIIAFFREEEVQDIISRTRPSTLAEALAAMEAAGGKKRPR